MLASCRTLGAIDRRCGGLAGGVAMLRASSLRNRTRTDGFRLAWPAKVLIGLTGLYLLSQTAIAVLDQAGRDSSGIMARWGWFAGAALGPILVSWTVFRATRGSIWACNAAYCALFAFVFVSGRLTE